MPQELKTTAYMATQPSSAIPIPSPESTPCCGKKAYIVPPVAVLVDVGLPLLLLIAFTVIFRFAPSSARGICCTSLTVRLSSWMHFCLAWQRARQFNGA